jgi:hypothetical protein
MAQSAEDLSSKCEALSSNPSTTKKKKKIISKLLKSHIFLKNQEKVEIYWYFI